MRDVARRCATGTHLSRSTGDSPATVRGGPYQIWRHACRSFHSRTCRCPHEQASPHARERRATPAGALLKALSTIERGMPRRWHQRRLVRTVQRTVIHKATHLTNHRHRPWWWIPQSVRGVPFLQLGPESSLRTTGRPTIWRSRPALRAGIRCLDRSDSPCWYSRGGHLPRAVWCGRYVDRRTCTDRRRGQWRELFATSGLPPGRCCWAPAANEFARSRAGRRS